MIQYLIAPRAGESPARLVSELIGQGVQWFTLQMPADAADVDVVEVMKELIPLCAESGAILIVAGHPELALNTVTANDVRAAGVIIPAASGNPAAVRELLGPHAIIGCEAASAAEILPLAGLDIDYFTLPVSEMTPALAGVEIPIVAVGADSLPVGFAGFLKEI